MTRVLLSAFEPFGGDATNPSQLAVRRLADEAGDALPGVELRTAFLPVVYGEAFAALRRAVAQADPEVVVCVGLAGGRTAVTPERLAVNVDDTLMPDNVGGAPVDRPVVDGGPAAYFSGLPVAGIVDALHAAGVPAAKSSTAGNYVCNHVFYGLMHLIATERPATTGGFVHVPCSHEQVLGQAEPRPSLSLDTIVRALAVVVRTSVTAHLGAPGAAAPARPAG